MSWSLIEALGAVEVELLLLEIGLGLGDVGLGGLFRGDVGGDVGLGGGDSGLLGLDVWRRAARSRRWRGLALLDVVAFFDVEVGDAAEGGGADVDIGLGLDLSGAADNGGQVLAEQPWLSEPSCSPIAA